MPVVAVGRQGLRPTPGSCRDGGADVQVRASEELRVRASRRRFDWVDARTCLELPMTAQPDGKDDGTLARGPIDDGGISPAERDPSRWPYGVLVVQSGLGYGLDGFHWFKDEAEAVGYFRETVWDDINEEWHAWFPHVRTAFSEGLAGVSSFSEDALLSVHRRQRFLDVVWWGTFGSLKAGCDAMALSIVQECREEAGIPDGEATPDALLEDYVQRYMRSD